MFHDTNSYLLWNTAIKRDTDLTKGATVDTVSTALLDNISKCSLIHLLK